VSRSRILNRGVYIQRWKLRVLRVHNLLRIPVFSSINKNDFLRPLRIAIYVEMNYYLFTNNKYLLLSTRQRIHFDIGIIGIIKLVRTRYINIYVHVSSLLTYICAFYDEIGDWYAFIKCVCADNFRFRSLFITAIRDERVFITLIWRLIVFGQTQTRKRITVLAVKTIYSRRLDNKLIVVSEKIFTRFFRKTYLFTYRV